MFDVSISSTLLTMWVVTAIVIVAALALGPRPQDVPGRAQNALEYVYEGLDNFGISLGGPPARPYVPLFATFFLFILFSNWSGLLPGVGKIEGSGRRPRT